MGKPGRPGPTLDDYLYWQERLEGRGASGLSIDEFCLDEGVSRSTFYRWVRRIQEGIPESVKEEGEAPTWAKSALPNSRDRAAYLTAPTSQPLWNLLTRILATMKTEIGTVPNRFPSLHWLTRYGRHHPCAARPTTHLRRNAPIRVVEREVPSRPRHHERRPYPRRHRRAQSSVHHQTL